MKWALPRIASVFILAGVVAVSCFSLVQSQVIRQDAAASPVFVTSNTRKKLAPTTSFSDAQLALSKLGINLQTASLVKLNYATWTNTDSTNQDVLNTAQLLQSEFSKYSPQYISSAGLKKIYLVRDLSVYTQSRSGMPEPNLEDALYFDVSDKYFYSENGAYMSRTLHHEFWHLIDHNTTGSYKGNAKAWQACNTQGATYGNGGGEMYADPHYAHAKHPHVGFINGYATSAIEEDRAEVYAAIMTEPDRIQELANSDTSINCKLSVLQQLMQKL